MVGHGTRVPVHGPALLLRPVTGSVVEDVEPGVPGVLATGTDKNAVSIRADRNGVTESHVVIIARVSQMCRDGASFLNWVGAATRGSDCWEFPHLREPVVNARVRDTHDEPCAVAVDFDVRVVSRKEVASHAVVTD